MEITETEILTEEDRLETEAVLKEVWPIPTEDLIKEFEEYLLDIGVRI